MPSILVLVPIVIAGILGWHLNRKPDSIKAFLAAALVFLGGIAAANLLVGQEIYVILTFMVVSLSLGFMLKSNVGRR